MAVKLLIFNRVNRSNYFNRVLIAF